MPSPEGIDAEACNSGAAAALFTLIRLASGEVPAYAFAQDACEPRCTVAGQAPRVDAARERAGAAPETCIVGGARRGLLACGGCSFAPACASGAQTTSSQERHVCVRLIRARRAGL